MRSKSRSPPRTSPNESKDLEPAFGRVDELDDPRPGHLSDGPTPISSTTTITSTLQDRFVKGEDQDHGRTKTTEEEGKQETKKKVENAEEQGVNEKMDEDRTEAGDQNTGKEAKAANTEGGEDKENQV